MISRGRLFTVVLCLFLFSGCATEGPPTAAPTVTGNYLSIELRVGSSGTITTVPQQGFLGYYYFVFSADYPFFTNMGWINPTDLQTWSDFIRWTPLGGRRGHRLGAPSIGGQEWGPESTYDNIYLDLPNRTVKVLLPVPDSLMGQTFRMNVWTGVARDNSLNPEIYVLDSLGPGLGKDSNDNVAFPLNKNPYDEFVTREGTGDFVRQGALESESPALDPANYANYDMESVIIRLLTVP